MMAVASKSVGSTIARAVWSAPSRCFGGGRVIIGPRGRLSRTPPLSCQQPSPDGEQVRQRRSDFQAMQVLRQAAVADLLESKYAFDDPDAVLNLRAHSGLVAVLLLDRLVDPLSPPVAAVDAVARPGSPRVDQISVALVGLVSPDAGLFPVQQVRQSQTVGYVRGRDEHRMNELVSAIYPQVRLHAEVILLPLGGLMHLWIALAVLVLCRARRADDRRIDDRAVADLDPVAGQIPVHGRQQLLAELVPLEQVPEFAHRGLIRRSFLAQVDAGETTHRRRVVQRFLHSRIGEVEPQLQEVHPQHPLKRNRRPATGFAHLRVVWLHYRSELCPRHDLIHLRQKLRAPCRLAVPFKARQRLLLHPIDLTRWDKALYRAGKSECP